VKTRIAYAVTSTLTLAAAGLVSATGTASAADTPPGGWDYVMNGTGVRVYVKKYGDVVSVCDSAKNGSAAEVEVSDRSVMDPPTYTLRVTNGYGSCVTRRASDGPRYNLDENEYISLTARGTKDVSSYWEWEYYNNR
jgi:hypothetical protein